MQDGTLFTDSKKVQTVTPYAKLRKLRGWSQEEAAERFFVSKRSIVDYELGRRDPPKQVIRMMDKEYGCNGQLIEYWLTKFSWGEPPPTVIERIIRLFRRSIRFVKSFLFCGYLNRG